MNKHINRSIAKLLFITIAAIFLSGCNIYFKPNESPSLKKINTDYTEIYQSTFGQAFMGMNFTRNGNIAAILSASEIFFYDPDKNKLIKKIQSQNWWSIDYGKSIKDGKRYLLIIDGFARTLDTTNWQTISQFKINGASRNTNLSENGTRLYTGSSLWNTETGKKITSGIGIRAPTGSDFSDNNHYFIVADGVYGPTLIDMQSKNHLEVMPEIEYSQQVLFRDNNSFYIDYGATAPYFAETLGLFSIDPQAKIAEITPYQSISCWTRLIEDNRLVMGLVDGTLLVLDEKLHVLKHWAIGSKALKCIGGKNGRVWMTTGVVEPSGPYEKHTAYNLYEVNVNQKTISSPVQLEGTIKHLAVSPDGKYIALVNDLPDKTMARIYLNNDL